MTFSRRGQRRLVQAVGGALVVLIGGLAACGAPDGPTAAEGQRQSASDCAPGELCHKIFLPGVFNNYSKRTERFEPADGKVFYGLGQVLSKWSSETRAAAEAVGVHPVLVSGYGSCTVSAFNRLIADLEAIASAENRTYIPVWGMGCPIGEVMDGSRDGELRALGAAMKAYGKPVFVRPLYEIAPPGAYGQIIADYCAAQSPPCDVAQTARTAFRRIIAQMQVGANGSSTTRIRNVARIWHVWVLPSASDYGAYYPGDTYVDWIGGSIFDLDGYAPSTMAHFNTLITFAEQRDRPVIIPESSPSWPNAGAGTCTWPDYDGYGVYHPDIIKDFFDPYFDLVRHPRVKAFVYITADWTQTVFCQSIGWPDARIERSSAVVTRFKSEVSDSSTYISWPFAK